MFLEELSLPHLVSQTLDSEPWINSVKLSKMCQLSLTYQSLLMLIPDLVKDKCVLELSLISSTVEQVDFTLKIKSSQKDAVIWTESNSFQQIKWLIKSESQDKQVWKFLMVNSLFVREPMPKVFMDWMNVSRDRRVTLMQEQTWFSQKVFTLLNNSRLLLNNWRIIRKIFSFWQTWLNSERLLTLTLIHLSHTDTTALFIQFPL